MRNLISSLATLVKPAPGPPIALSRKEIWIGAAWTLAVASSCVALGPFWDTHDDVYGAMTSAGYGLTTVPSSLLFYSSAAFAQGLHALRPLFGDLVYPITLYLVLVLSATVLVALVVSRVRPAIGILLSTGLLVPAFLFPQFTVIASLAALAGFLLVLDTEPERHGLRLAASLLLVALGMMIRFEAALITIAISSPLVVVGRRRTKWWAPAIAFVFLAVGVVSYDRFVARESPQWREYHEVDARRLPFSDYHYADYLERHGQCLDGAGLTRNDVLLLEHWFYADPAITAPEKLDPVLACVSMTRRLRDNLSVVRYAVPDFLRSFPGNMLVLAMVVALFRRAWVAVVAGALFSAAFVAFSLLGRPFPFHVSYPLAVLVCIVAITQGEARVGARRVSWLLSLALLGVMAHHFGTRFIESTEAKKQVEEDLSSIERFGRLPYVWAGSAIRLDVLYPPFDPANRSKGAWVFLGALYRSPMVQAVDVRETCRGFVACLLSGAEVNVFTGPEHIELLRVYLREHHGRDLRVEEPYKLRRLRFFRLTTSPSPVKTEPAIGVSEALHVSG